MKRSSERGFTLVELIVTVALIVLLFTAGGVWLLAMRPGALAQATDDYDAAVASARALATTSGNGATLVFAPRPGGKQGTTGFILRVYAGRPTGAKAVTATTSMPVVSDATVTEKTLGAPAFALFFGASGHVSGEAAYPKIDEKTGDATFPAIALEPSCPAQGFVLTFTGPQGATATRALACTQTSATSSSGVPNPSPTPNVPIVTPTALVYHWPADSEQRFVATEWGYTHWFATRDGFACGNGVATFPNVLPLPYSAPQNTAEASASPSPPPHTPYAYPNAGGGSMNDAPAMFPLDPSNAGLCSAVVVDDYGQQAQTAVQVMGWLTATYGGKDYTHLTQPALTFPTSAFATKGTGVTVPLSKTFDSEALTPQVALDDTCAQYLTSATKGGTTPNSPSTSAATANITLTLDAQPSSPLSCGGTIYDQYAGSQGGEGIAFNATIGSQSPLVVWPPSEQTALSGTTPPTTLSAAEGGGTCYARAFSDAQWTTPEKNKTKIAADGTTVVVKTDSTGCMLDATGTPLSGGAVAQQDGFSGDFSSYPSGCVVFLAFARGWSPIASGMGPGPDMIGFAGTQIGTCTMTVGGSASNQATPAPVAVEVVGCNSSGNAGIGYLPIGDSCTVSAVAEADQEYCTYQSDEGGNLQSGLDGKVQFQAQPPNLGSLSYDVGTSSQPPQWTFTRTSAGSVTIKEYGEYVEWRLLVQRDGAEACASLISLIPVASWVIN